MKKLLLLAVISSCMIGCTKMAGENTAANSSSTNSVTSRPSPPVSPAAPKGERGTPDEAKTMLEKAVEHYNSAGRETALADFTAKKAPFFDRDLYVACIGPNDTLVANGGFPNLVGQSTNSWKDADGNPLGKAIRDALARNEDSIKFRWYNPTNGKIEPKVFFFRKVGNDICGVGAYNP